MTPHRNSAAVSRAVKAAGGPDAVVKATGASRRSVFRWQADGYVANAAWCVKLASASGTPSAILSGAVPDPSKESAP